LSGFLGDFGLLREERFLWESLDKAKKIGNNCGIIQKKQTFANVSTFLTSYNIIDTILFMYGGMGIGWGNPLHKRGNV